MNSIFLVAGVSGSGKSTIGRLLAAEIGARFLDGDDFHPPANVRKMANGEPLTDADRIPWLDKLAHILSEHASRGEGVVLACSALRKSYRARLRESVPTLQTIYLDGSQALLAARMRQRKDHFMKAEMLESQLAALEEPEHAIRISIDQPARACVEEILRLLSRDGGQGPGAGIDTPH